ncbi:ABC transporter ATP-binding protein [uncultured Muribaculum sp.]|uniref:ABC transporter ATP-binding protein n=1 Tax=uncultured Muribaculum sp. TaxID=1918613 RepID=UPI002599BC66|nr:ABC transporter ATP-binding protein [uncultured Muribaculum sp.]
MINDSTPVISVKHLTQRYGTGRVIYSDLNFEVPKGRILGLLGKNGTGKTTTINILMGYLRPVEGDCRIFGEKITEIRPETRARIALLIEGHVQYSFMTISQIEKFYSRFYRKWNREAYYELMKKLHVSPNQKISSMSCGQRSQVALGLILAQNADLLVLDDFSLGLDPGYRRLFVDYLHDYAKSEEKTVFMTSHIIQDLERLIDDCIILDYGKILTHTPVNELLDTFSKFTFSTTDDSPLPDDDKLVNPYRIKNLVEVYSFRDADYVKHSLEKQGIKYSGFRKEEMNLEDAFIGLTGKY